ncbi:MAG: surface lipoprotein assembly modifier [Burkholderiaceae bacterium]
MVNLLQPSVRLKLLCICLSASAFFAHAQTDELVKNGQALNAQGQWLEAFKLLEPSEAQRAGEPGFDLAIGIAANGAGQFMRAILALERVLSVQPNNPLARAELGRALFAVGDTVGARKQLNQSKLLGAPEQLVIASDQLLQVIDNTEAKYKSSVSGYISASLGRDTNVNSGPADANVAVPAFGGLVFALDPSAVKAASDFGSAGAGISGRFVIDPRWALVGNAHITAHRHPVQTTPFDSERTNVQTGVNYREERNELALALNLDVTRLNQALARKQTGVTADWAYHLTQFQQLSSYFQATRLLYSEALSERNANRYVFGANFLHTFRDALTVYAGAYAGTEQALRKDLPHLSNRFAGLLLGAQKPLTETVMVFGSLGYEHRQYGAPEPLFLVTRQDNQLNAGLGLHWIPEPFWRVTPQISLSRTQSDIAINEFDKRVISVTARRNF